MATKASKRTPEQAAFVKGAVRAAHDSYQRMEGYSDEKKRALKARVKRRPR